MPSARATTPITQNILHAAAVARAGAAQTRGWWQRAHACEQLLVQRLAGRDDAVHVRPRLVEERRHTVEVRCAATRFRHDQHACAYIPFALRSAADERIAAA